MSILAIDYGSKKVGLALAEDDRLVLPLSILVNQGDKALIKEIAAVVKRYDISLIILGYPINLVGQVTTQTRKVQNFYQELQRIIKIPVKLVDERFSSKTVKVAQRGLKIKHHDDAAAAAVILQSYLDSQVD